MNKILLLSLAIFTLAECKKTETEPEKKEEPKSVTGLRFKNYWFTGSGGTYKCFRRLILAHIRRSFTGKKGSRKTMLLSAFEYPATLQT